MSRNLFGALALGAGLALATGANAQVVFTCTVQAPVLANDEFSSTVSNLDFTIPAGLVAAAGFTNGNLLTGVLRPLDSMGNAIFIDTDLTTGFTNGNGTISNGGAYSNAAGNTFTCDLSVLNQTGLAAIFGLTSLDELQVRVIEVLGSPDTNSCATLFDTSNKAADQCFAPLTTPPALTQALYQDNDPDPDTIYFVYSRAMSASADGSGANALNNTVAANITALDYQASATNAFTAATGPPSGTFTPQANLLDAGFTTIVVDVLSPEISVGSFIRTVADDNGVGLSTVVKGLANLPASQGGTATAPVTTGVQVTALPSLMLAEVEFIATVPNGGFTASAARVRFNNPLASIGNTAFYDQLMLAGGTTDLAVVGVAADPSDATAVLLDLNSGGNDGVAADGLSNDSNGNASTGTYTLELTDAVGTPPQDIFTQSFTGTASATAQDGIDPPFAFGGSAFYDRDNDGFADATGLVFGEPINASTTDDGLELSKVGGVTTTPFNLIEPDGTLVNGMTVASADPNDDIIPFTFELGSTDIDRDGTVTPRETNNTLILNFDPFMVDWDLMGSFDSGNLDSPIPGTPDPGATTVAVTAADVDIEDAVGNPYSAGDQNLASNEDYAPPALFEACFYTGDNQTPVTTIPFNIPASYTGNNLQFFSEQEPLTTGNLGDQVENNRLSLIFGENLPLNATVNGPNSFQINFVQYGTSGVFSPDTTANDISDFLFQSQPNDVTLGFRESVATGNDANIGQLQPGANINVLPDSGMADAAGNSVVVNNAVAEDCVALFSANRIDVNGDVFKGPFLNDSSGDGFVDQIVAPMTQPVDATTLDSADFMINLGGTITGASVSPTSDSTILLAVTDGQISTENTVTLNYNGATAATPINSDVDEGGNGVAMSAVNDVMQIEGIATPDISTYFPAIMDLQGTITLDGTTPAPVGTTVFAMVAMPTVNTITARHNNIEFTIEVGQPEGSIPYVSTSLESFTNFLAGINTDVYLYRNEDNIQWYGNSKFSDVNRDGNADSTVLFETIRLNINANNLARITFTGTGEAGAAGRPTNRLTNGTAGLCWDVIRSSDGTASSFYTGGYQIGGQPIVSSGVVTGETGLYGLHVGSPISDFNGARLDTIGLPVIIVVQLPSGERFACSSLLTSGGTVTIGDDDPVDFGPLPFTPNNRTQASGGVAEDAVQFDINLANVGSQSIHPEWNCVAYPRTGGWAQANNRVPVLVIGQDEDDITVSNALPFAGGFDQFVYWNDLNADGSWTIDDDTPSSALLQSVFVDADCVSYFGFTMTSFGVEVSGSLTNLVGGYGFGFFNPSSTTYGCFQFGNLITDATLFDDGDFPNNNTTQGWALVANTAGFDPASGFFTSNDDADFIILFNNLGSDGIAVGSLEDGASADNINDLEVLNAGEAPFVHFE